MSSIFDRLHEPKRKKAGLTFNKNEGRFVITFDWDISKSELLEEWNRFTKVRHEITGKSRFNRKNEPSDVDLLLGIQFLRLCGAKWGAIHDAYMNKEVPHYKGKYGFDTEFDLQKYYNRNIDKVKDI